MINWSSSWWYHEDTNDLCFIFFFFVFSFLKVRAMFDPILPFPSLQRVFFFFFKKNENMLLLLLFLVAFCSHHLKFSLYCAFAWPNHIRMVIIVKTTFNNNKFVQLYHFYLTLVVWSNSTLNVNSSLPFILIAQFVY